MGSCAKNGVQAECKQSVYYFYSPLNYLGICLLLRLRQISLASTAYSLKICPMRNSLHGDW